MTNVSSYIETNISNISSFNDLVSAINNSGGGYLFLTIDLIVFLVLFISLSGTFGWEAGLLTSAFVSMILSLLFLYMGVVGLWIVGIFIGLILITIMYIMWSNRNN